MEELKDEAVFERYGLCCERIREVSENPCVHEKYADYFKKTADFILLVTDEYERLKGEKQDEPCDIGSLREKNRALYADIIGSAYDESYANPLVACSRLGDDFGQPLSFLYAEIRCMIAAAYEDRLWDMTIRMELFLEIYNMFEYARAEAELECLPEKAKEPSREDVIDVMYWFVSDYSEPQALLRVKSQLDPENNFAMGIIMGSDLSDIRYLYSYGEYISEDTEKMASYLNSLPQERIQLIADTYTEGYRIGFVKGNKDLSKKSTVDIRYVAGFERIVKAAVGNFEAMGLKPVIYRAGSSIFNKNGINKIGFYGAVANNQYDYDHKDDIALFWDKKLMNRKLEVLKSAYSQYKELAAEYAGPAVMETFGEIPFVPETKSCVCRLDDEQQKLSTEYRALSAELVNRYIRGEERSYTIIAFPVPEIGERFGEIFDETVKLNTLDYHTYERIQADIIAALDKASCVKIKGMNGNRTDLTVKLIDINDSKTQTKFENCVADVNIPVGEVFTSPMLEGTCGVLHVSRVFLNGLEYRNLELEFVDGRIKSYGCSNFDDEESCRKYVRENVMFNYETLPMGEFAIGTNTTAYMAAKKYNIEHLFPILIAEKTGPHFAVGDTCYSRCEDVKVYNEDGKEIMARDNSISILRKSDSSKAYFGCHTDITIPYDELGSITACCENGEEYKIIENGRFVLEGAEELNAALDGIELN